MKLLIDTSLKTMFLSLVKDGKTISFYQEVMQKKADALPNVFKTLLDEANISANDLKEIYVTTGPGSFMGARTALTFVRTIAQVIGATLYATDTLSFISGGVEGEYYIDAKSNQSYRGVFDGARMIVSLVEFKEDSPVDYSSIVDGPNAYLSTFKKVDPLECFPTYYKEPRIGGE